MALCGVADAARGTEALAAIRGFAGEFQRAALYETGYADSWRVGGATTADTREDMIAALAYVKGTTDCARLACAYESKAYRVANLVGIAAASLRCAVEGEESVRAVERRIESYVAELSALVKS